MKKSSEKDSLYSVCHIQMWFVLDIVFSWSFVFFFFFFVIGQCLRKGKNRKKGWKKGEIEEGKKKRREEFWKKSLNFPNLGTVDSCLAAFRGCWLASISENSWHCPVSQSLPPFIAFWNVDVTLLVPVDSEVAGCVHVNYWTVMYQNMDIFSFGSYSWIRTVLHSSSDSSSVFFFCSAVFLYSLNAISSPYTSLIERRAF